MINVELMLYDSGFQLLQCSLQLLCKNHSCAECILGEQRPSRLAKFSLINNVSLYYSQFHVKLLEQFSIHEYQNQSNYFNQSQQTENVQWANQNSKQLHTSSKVGEKCTRASHNWYWFCFSLVEKVACILNQRAKQCKQFPFMLKWKPLMTVLPFFFLLEMTGYGNLKWPDTVCKWKVVPCTVATKNNQEWE